MPGVVDLNGHRLVLESDQRTQTAERVSGVAKSFRAVAHLLHDVSPQPCVGDVDEMPDRRVAVMVLEGDAAGVQTSHQPLAEDLDRGFGVERDAQSAPKVATRSCLLYTSDAADE